MFAYRAIGRRKSRKHVLVASLLLLVILLDLLLADSDLVLRCLVIRLELVDLLEIDESLVDLAECEKRLTATVESFDAVRIEAESFVALKIFKILKAILTTQLALLTACLTSSRSLSF